jgi:hypothetical protein
MNLKDKYRKTEKIVSRRIGDEQFLVPLSGRLDELQKIFILNPVADLIWQQLNGQRTLADILAAITDNFAVSKDQAGANLGEFIAQLQAEGLIEGVA